jgi:hypothetical protein
MGVTWRDEDAGDIAFADDVTSYELPPAGKIIRRGGAYEVENPWIIPPLPKLLLHLADAGVDFLDPDAAGLVPRDEVVAFCLYHGIQIEQALRLARGGHSYKVLIKQGLLQDIWLNLRLFQEGDPLLAEIGVPIPVAELHSPPVEGCESAYEVLAEHSGSAGLRLRVRGLGAGGGLSAKLKFRDRLWTEAACGQITIPGDIEVVPWNNPDSGERIEVVSITNIREGAWSLVDIPIGRLHLCSDSFDDRLEHFREAERKGWLREGADFFQHTVTGAEVTVHERVLLLVQGRGKG